MLLGGAFLYALTVGGVDHEGGFGVQGVDVHVV